MIGSATAQKVMQSVRPIKASFFVFFCIVLTLDFVIPTGIIFATIGMEDLNKNSE